MLYELYIAAANATVGTNLFAGQEWAKQGRNCRVTQIACVGSSGEWDSRYELSYGATKIAEFYNSNAATTADENDFFFISSQKYCPSSKRLNCEVLTAPGAAIKLIVNVQPVRRRARRRFRR